MPSKIKKLYNKAKKGLKNIVLRKKHTQAQEAKISNNKSKPLIPEAVDLWQKKVETSKAEASKAENVKKDKKGIKEKIKSLKTKPVEKELKRGSTFKNGFKKLKERVKKLNPIKVKKNKIIENQKLAFLLTSGTIVAILPMFNLAPLSALVVTSGCVFSINFIVVNTLKKVIKQRKLAAKSEAEPEKLEEVSVKQVKPKQIFRDGK